ncbi:MAG TPA: RHS repeat-associated core domain-containing protein [Allosphingosinicella sp.]|jgi:RHS repeat-associated protein
MGTRTLYFDLSGGAYQNRQGSGEALAQSGATWTFTDRDGTAIQFDKTPFNASADRFYYFKVGVSGVAQSITLPTGEKMIFNYKERSNTTGAGTRGGAKTTSHLRVQSVTSSSGLMLKFEYSTNSTTSLVTDWLSLAKVSGINNSVDYCDPAADSCTSLTQTWPAMNLSTSASGTDTVYTVTDASGRAATYTLNSAGSLTAFRRPGSTTDDETATYGSDGRVSSVSSHGRNWTYSWSSSAPLLTATRTNPDATQRTAVIDTTVGLPTSEQDELGRTTSYTYDTYGRLTQVASAEGNKLAYAYDSRGNVTQSQEIAKNGITTITKAASFPSTCTNSLTCNKPTSVTDARSNATDFTYDSTHGGLVTVTLPAPTPLATRPQTRFTYTALQAYLKNSAGSIVASGQNTYRLTAMSQCQSGSSCAGTSDEALTTFGYGSPGTANNLLLTTSTAGTGDGSLSATTTTSYNIIGNVTSVDGAIAGSGDTTSYRWNADRELVGVIAPDPDGSGALKNPAIRTTYDAGGHVTKIERGTVNSASDADWAAFSSQMEVDTAYDSSGRPVTQSTVAGGTAYGLTQMSYDTNGRPQCAATRMNPSTYASLPSDACTLAAASTSYGSDRIVKSAYDAAGEVTKMTAAFGTSDAADLSTMTYSSNGKVASVTDAEGNKTSYVYDGFDRLYQTLYPSSSKGAGSSDSSNYEQFLYDDNGNVTSQRTRANETLTYSYDALNRRTVKNVPTSSSGASSYSTYFGYDLLGRMLYARFASITGSGITNTYDGLGRLTSAANNMSGAARTVSYAYDLHNNRTRVTHPDGNYASYSYDGLDRLTAVQENGGSSVIAAYTFDNTGARISTSHFGSSTSAYSYDAIGRLTSLGHDLAGTTYDQSLSFTYNPADQVVTRSGSNDSYAWTGHYNVSRGYTANGLNQYTASGSASPTYDGNANLTSDGSTSFVYDAENHLVTASGSHAATVAYDPLGRMSQLTSGTATTQFLYDGSALLDEFDASGNYLRRFAHGAGADEPIGWYEGSNTLVPLPDERGSPVGFADRSGNGVAIDTYDEYGIPRSSNIGRFQYTGQAWLSELGLYYYKARFYSPTMGRFLQTDPVGYGSGMNRYAYVGSDPVNSIDPTGLTPCAANRSDCLPPKQDSDGGEGGDDGDGGDDENGGGPPIVVEATRLPNAALEFGVSNAPGKNDHAGDVQEGKCPGGSTTARKEGNKVTFTGTIKPVPGATASARSAPPVAPGSVPPEVQQFIVNSINQYMSNPSAGRYDVTTHVTVSSDGLPFYVMPINTSGNSQSGLYAAMSYYPDVPAYSGKLAAHEWGHGALGLFPPLTQNGGHNSDPNSIMNANTGPRITEADVAAALAACGIK